MHRSIFGGFAVAVATVAMLAVAILWSFNLLSEWLGGPQAQLQHAVAAAVLVLILRSALIPHRRDFDKAGDRRHPSAEHICER